MDAYVLPGYIRGFFPLMLKAQDVSIVSIFYTDLEINQVSLILFTILFLT